MRMTQRGLFSNFFLAMWLYLRHFPLAVLFYAIVGAPIIYAGYLMGDLLNAVDSDYVREHFDSLSFVLRFGVISGLVLIPEFIVTFYVACACLERTPLLAWSLLRTVKYVFHILITGVIASLIKLVSLVACAAAAILFMTLLNVTLRWVMDGSLLGFAIGITIGIVVLIYTGWYRFFVLTFEWVEYGVDIFLGTFLYPSIMAVEKKFGISAFMRARELTKHLFWSTAFAWLLAYLPVAACSLFSFLLLIVGFDCAPPLVALLNLLAPAFASLMMLCTYFTLRTRTAGDEIDAIRKGQTANEIAADELAAEMGYDNRGFFWSAAGSVVDIGIVGAFAVISICTINLIFREPVVMARTRLIDEIAASDTGANYVMAAIPLHVGFEMKKQSVPESVRRDRPTPEPFGGAAADETPEEKATREQAEKVVARAKAFEEMTYKMLNRLADMPDLSVTLIAFGGDGMRTRRYQFEHAGPNVFHFSDRLPADDPGDKKTASVAGVKPVIPPAKTKFALPDVDPEKSEKIIYDVIQKKIRERQGVDSSGAPLPPANPFRLDGINFGTAETVSDKMRIPLTINLKDFALAGTGNDRRMEVSIRIAFYDAANKLVRNVTGAKPLVVKKPFTDEISARAVSLKLPLQEKDRGKTYTAVVKVKDEVSGATDSGAATFTIPK